MSERRADAPDIEEIARRAQAGEDVSEHFTNKFVAKQRVNVDFPLDLLREIDTECKLVGVTRQAWIKMACDERLRQIRSGRVQKAS
jgi:predicted neuraminidase